MNVFDYIKLLFDGAWGLLGIEYPGIGLTFGAIAIGALAVTLSLRLLGHITGASFSPGRTFASLSGGNNKKIKVSNARKGDQH